MRVMAAALAAHAGETETAIYMWTNILNSTDDTTLRANAINRLRCLRVDSEVKILQDRVDEFTKQNGHAALGLAGVDLGRIVASRTRSIRRTILTDWWEGGCKLRSPICFPSLPADCPQDKKPETCPAKRDSRSQRKTMMKRCNAGILLLLLICSPALWAQSARDGCTAGGGQN